MAEQQTCGQGLADHSALPALLGRVMAGVADVLDLHTNALDLTDENATIERDVYVKLVAAHRETAEELRSIANTMAAARDLPMARHDQTELASPTAADAFARFLSVEEELAALIETRVGRDREMLETMRRAA